MRTKDIKFSKQIQEEEIYLALVKNYSISITDFFEFERQWFFRSFKAFKDYDKYLILVYLFQKTFNSYADYFIKNTYEDFYSKDSFEIVKFNIIDVSRNLLIKKETARRKLIELENDDVIQKNKKVVKLNQKAINIQKPNESVNNISRFFSNFSKILEKNKLIKKYISTDDFEKLIKKNFTQCWKFFLDFQMPYALKGKKFYGDLEIFMIISIIIYNQNLNIRKNSLNVTSKDSFDEEYIKNLNNMNVDNGVNAMTISDMTGIPRPTVLRKLNKMLKKKLIIKDKNNLYGLADKYENLKTFNDLRLDTVKRLSKMMAKFYNFVNN